MLPYEYVIGWVAFLILGDIAAATISRQPNHAASESTSPYLPIVSSHIFYQNHTCWPYMVSRRSLPITLTTYKCSLLPILLDPYDPHVVVCRPPRLYPDSCQNTGWPLRSPTVVGGAQDRGGPETNHALCHRRTDRPESSATVKFGS